MTSATFASVAIPEMNRYGYDVRLSTGIVATVGTLGVIMPPSVVLIILGILTEQSIGQLFLAGVIPGLLIGVLFIGIIYGWAKMSPRSHRNRSGRAGVPVFVVSPKWRGLSSSSASSSAE